MESNHLNKPVYKPKRKNKTKQNKNTICESSDKYKEQQKDKYEDVKKDIKIIKWEKKI